MGTLAGIVANPLEPSPLFELAPSEKTSVLGSFEVGGCSQASLNKLYRIEGHLFAQPQLNASRPSGAWLIPASSNSISVGNIRVGGQLAAASGELVAETTEGAIEIISMG